MPPVCPAAVGAAAGAVAGCSVRLCGLQCAGLALEKFRNFLEGAKNNLPILATKRSPPPSPLPDGLCCCCCCCFCFGRSCTAKRAPQAEPALCPCPCTGLLHCTALLLLLLLPLLLLVGRVERTRHPLRCCLCCGLCCCLCSLWAALVGRAFQRSLAGPSTQPAARHPLCSLRAGTRAQAEPAGSARGCLDTSWERVAALRGGSSELCEQQAGKRSAQSAWMRTQSLCSAHRACT